MADQARSGEESEALRHLSAAESKAPRLAAVAGVEPRAVAAAGVIGTGIMGAGITLAFANAGLAVTMVARNSESLERGRARVLQTYERAVASGRLSVEEAQKRTGLIRFADDVAALADVDLVVEAVVEDIAVKEVLLRSLGVVAKPRAMLATNTSFLDVDLLARCTARPGDVVGLHFFSPAHVMRLLEVVQGAETSPDVLATALAIGKGLGKISVVTKPGEGFIGNRIYTAYRNQCEFMLEEGAYPEQVDAALEGFGFAMGPFAVGDLTGLDIAWKRRQRQAATRDARIRTPDTLDRLCEAGHCGQKTGKGWYAYETGARKGKPHEQAHRIIEESSARKGLKRRDFSDTEIVTRAIAVIVNEAALLLADGIAQRASDIDVVMVHGYGFPASRGGPLFWASRRPRAEITAALDLVEQATGFGFQRGAVDAVLNGHDED